NGQHRKRNGAGAITMEAAVEELTPLGVLKQPKVLGAWSEVWTYSRAGELHSNLAGARDIERRAMPKCAMPAVPPPGSVQNLSPFRFWVSGARPWLTR